jgi:two-component system, NtrC family, response regulator GlrR
MQHLNGNAKCGYQPRILLLNLDFRSPNERSLNEALKSLNNISIQLRNESFDRDALTHQPERLLKAIQSFAPHLILLLLSTDMLRDPNHLRSFMGKKHLRVPIIGAIEPEHPDDLTDLLRAGIVDFIVPPFKSIEVFGRIWQVLRNSYDAEVSTQYFSQALGREQMIGAAPTFLEAVRRIRLLAACDVGIMISGETGTGKELAARAIHYLSARTSGPFVPVNCGAIPLDLVENELFGHERGAFTGALGHKTGLIREADRGTIFLDEVDSLPLLAQVKLLRFLESKEYRALGSSKSLTADVRIIAASNANLDEALRTGRLRQDLYHRLNVVPLVLPPLGDRPGDILLLAQHFLRRYTSEFNKQSMSFSPETMRDLCLYHWPGNVRELQHVVERAVLLCDGRIIDSRHLLLGDAQETAIQGSFQELKAQVVSQFEQSYIRSLLSAYRGNITRAAKAAKKECRTFRALIRKHKIDVQRFKTGH